MSSVLFRAREAFRTLVRAKDLSTHPIRVTTRTLSAEEAIGKPRYDDLPLLRGKEVMIEAQFEGAKGHAFTTAPAPWQGALGDLFALSLDRSSDRAVLTAAMNAVLRSLGEIDRTVHCRDDDIARCGREMAERLRREFGRITVGQIGYQPGLLAGLVGHFGPDRVCVTDLREDNIGREAHGVEIWDGAHRTGDLVASSSLVLATGSMAANGTLDGLLDLTQEADVPLVLYGVTAAAVCHLCSIRRLCLLAA